jgi:hypothetical protein
MATTRYGDSLGLTMADALIPRARGCEPCAIEYETRSRCACLHVLMREESPEMTKYSVSLPWIAS